MKKRFILTMIVPFLFISLTAFSQNAKNQQDRLRSALRSGGSNYFATVNPRQFNMANMGAKSSVIQEFTSYASPRTIWKAVNAISAVIYNRYVPVRLAVYQEMKYLANPRIISSLNRTSQGKRALRLLLNRVNSKLRTEHNRRAKTILMQVKSRFERYNNQSTPDQGKRQLKRALRTANYRYFMRVRWNVFSRANIAGKTSLINSFIMTSPTNAANAIQAMLGAFSNSDGKVRGAIYRELIFFASPYIQKRFNRYANGRRAIARLKSKVRVKNEFDRYAKYSFRLLKRKLLKSTDNSSQEKTKLRRALMRGNSRYFRSTKWRVFSRANIAGKTSLINSFCSSNARNAANGIRAMLGAFSNPDGKVRGAIYRELSNLVSPYMQRKFNNYSSYRRAISMLKSKVRIRSEFNRYAKYSFKNLKRKLLSAPQRDGYRDNYRKDRGNRNHGRYRRDYSSNQRISASTISRALQTGNSYVFTRMTRRDFMRFRVANIIRRSLNRSPQNAVRALRALFGAFNNRDAMVRRDVYKEILFYSSPRKINALKRTPNGRGVVATLKIKILMKRDNDRAARSRLNQLKRRFRRY